MFQQPRCEVHNKSCDHGDEKKDSEIGAGGKVNQTHSAIVNKSEKIWVSEDCPGDHLNETKDSNAPQRNSMNLAGVVGEFSDVHGCIVAV